MPPGLPHVRYYRSAPLHSQSAPFILFLSGDGLINRFEHGLANSLLEAGAEIAVLRSLHFFWRARTPDEVAAAIENILPCYSDTDELRRIIVVGYSFGGAITPFALDALCDAQRNRISAVVLIAPARHADFEFTFRSWLNLASPRARNVSRQICLLCRQGMKVLTILARHDAQRAVAPKEGRCHSIVLPGGHGFRRDFKTLAGLIIDAGAKR